MNMQSFQKNGLSGLFPALLLIGTMYVSVSSADANGSISGTVSSSGDCTYLNGKPLCTGALMPVAQCTVTVSKPGSAAAIVYSGITDNSGKYSISNIAIAGSSDTFQVKASAGPGYSVVSQKIALNAGQAQTVNSILRVAFSNRGIITNDSLSFTVSTDKSEYNLGDSIFVHYSIQNTSTHSIQYWYTPGCEGDLIMTGIKGDTVYWLGKNRACVTMMGQGSIAPDSTIAMKFAGVPATAAMDSIVTVVAKATTPSFKNSEAPINISINKPAVIPTKDTVYVTPPDPTAKDSLHFDLFNYSFNCCTQYYNKNVTVSDTTITLSFEYLDSNKCLCLVAGSHTAFACGPQKAGKYAIYKAQSIYCATPPCPLVRGPIQLVRVGEVVVGGTAARAPAAPLGNGGMELSLTQDNSALKIACRMNRPGRLTMNIFNARGGKVETLCEKQMTAGTGLFSWPAAAPGVYFVSVKVNDIALQSRKVIISR